MFFLRRLSLIREAKAYKRNVKEKGCEIVAEKNSALTPMMQQYMEVKEQYKDCILMYRLGDFYEMFFDDAVVAANILDITLTGKNCGLKERAPMCGVPFHSVDSYIVKLVTNGYHVAVCEQTEDPKAAKGIVKREVVRVVTPGTIMDADALDAAKNNYLCAVYADAEGIGCALVDITTGDLAADQFLRGDVQTELLNMLAKNQPSELIINLYGYENQKLVDALKDRIQCFVKNYYDWAFKEQEAYPKLEKYFGAEVVERLRSRNKCACALGALLQYLEDTQKTELKNLHGIELESSEETLQLDMYALRNLEVLETMRDRRQRGSLFGVLNKTKTAMGARLMRKWLTAPLMNCARIQNRHLAVEEFFKNPILREEIFEILKNIKDVERIINRITYKSANGQSLLALKDSFAGLPRLKEKLSHCSSKLLRTCFEELDTLDDLRELIEKTIDPDAPATVRNGKMIRPGANEELDKYSSIVTDGRGWLAAMVEEEKQKTGIKTMKLGYNKVFGYYIEVSNLYTAQVPEYFIRKQTLTNGERYITPKIKEMEEMILNADTKLLDLEYDIFCQVRDQVAAEYERVQKTADIIARVDVLAAFAYVAEKNRYVMPTVTMDDKIYIKNGRHPVVEQLNQGAPFIPNDVTLDCRDDQILIITGPNMAGKSTYMRQVAVCVLMAQAGCFVPADAANIGIVDKIFTRVGAADDLSSGQSTFMVEMNEVAYILDNVTSKSLLILDEIGRGTSTYDGLSIAWAVVEYIADKVKCGAKTMFATHYHELTVLEDKVGNVKNYCVAVKKRGDDIHFLRKIIRGGADDSYGVEVAALAGVKKSVIKRAKEIVKTLEGSGQQEVREARIRGAEKKETSGGPQMDFFAAAEPEVLSELKALDLNSMSPMEALTKLYDLQARAKQG